MLLVEVYLLLVQYVTDSVFFFFIICNAIMLCINRSKRKIKNDGVGNNVNETQSFLDNNQRQCVSELVLHSCHRGKFCSEIIKRVESYFSVSRDVIYRIWKQIRETGVAYHKKTQIMVQKDVIALFQIFT